MGLSPPPLLLKLKCCSFFCRGGAASIFILSVLLFPPLFVFCGRSSLFFSRSGLLCVSRPPLSLLGVSSLALPLLLPLYVRPLLVRNTMSSLSRLVSPPTFVVGSDLLLRGVSPAMCLPAAILYICVAPFPSTCIVCRAPSSIAPPFLHEVYPIFPFSNLNNSPLCVPPHNDDYPPLWWPPVRRLSPRPFADFSKYVLIK